MLMDGETLHPKIDLSQRSHIEIRELII
jgi:hypothetical protein